MKLFALACAAGALTLFTAPAQAQVKPGIMERFGTRQDDARSSRRRPAPERARTAAPELQGRLLKLIERHDLDKDGKLNAQEARAAREAWAKLRSSYRGQKPGRHVSGARKGEGRGSKGSQAPKDKQGPKGPKEGSPFHLALLERFDANGNGVLDGPEAAKARSHWARVRADGSSEHGQGERVKERRPQSDARRVQKKGPSDAQRRSGVGGQDSKARSPRRPGRWQARPGSRKPQGAGQSRRATLRRASRR